jgi:hypothetical protein
MDTIVKRSKSVVSTKKVTKGANLQKVTNYQTNVLNVNKSLHKECKSLGGARAILLTFAKQTNMKASFIRLLKLSESKENYEMLTAKVRKSKNGNYSPFFILQSLNKNEEYFATNFKK